MPTLMIRTNVTVDPGAIDYLLEDASQTVAAALEKSARYVMVGLVDGLAMRLAGSDAPLALLELRSIGLAEDRCADLSSELCRWVEQRLGVSADRVYIDLTDVPRSRWGWDGGTF